MPPKATYLITGATSGIGSFLAHHFAAKGVALILHGRNKNKLDQLRKQLKSPAAVMTVVADLVDMRQIDRMFEQIRKEHRTIEVLINNAFGKLESELVDADAKAISEHIQTSLAGTAEIIKQSVPLLRHNNPGFVINIVADWGVPMHNVLTGPSVYVATKYAVYGLGAALQLELGKHNIRTTNICPGPVGATTEFGASASSFVEENGNKVIHPITIANAIDFVVTQQFAHIRTIVISPVNPEYTGF